MRLSSWRALNVNTLAAVYVLYYMYYIIQYTYNWLACAHVIGPIGIQASIKEVQMEIIAEEMSHLMGE